MCPPQLLTQDSETTSRQIEDRVAQLLSEEVELSCTPPLPASRIFQEELEHAGWRLQLPEGKRNFLWQRSALTGALAEESFYTASLVPLIVSQRPPKVSSAPPNAHLDGLWKEVGSLATRYQGWMRRSLINRLGLKQQRLYFMSVATQ